MKIPVLTRWLEERQLKANLSKFDEFMDFLVDGREGAAGVTVTEKTALHSTAVFACVRVLAETIASLPLPIYRRLDPRGKQRAPEHPLYRILHDQPNPYMTSFAFRETLMGHLGTWGNAYAEIDWTSGGQVKALWPLRPDRMKEIKYNKAGNLVYVYRLPDGTDKTFLAYQILHIPGMGFDGFMGYSPIRMARDAVGLSLATEEYGARFFKNGAKPGGVLEHPGKLKNFETLRKSWNEMHQGLHNQHRIAILEEGMKYTQIGIPPNDAQFLETRKFQKSEIASIYRVPPHMIADLERATFSNIEHQSIDFVVHTIRPWLVRWEQAIKQKLFMNLDGGDYFAEFLVDGLLRGDTQSRYAAYSVGRQWGWLSANDVLEMENRNPIGEQGDIYMVPMNMIPAEQVAIVPEIKEPPTEEDDRSGEPSLEQRNIRAAMNRARLAKRFEPAIRDAASRVVKREVRDLKRAVKNHLRERDSTDFLVYLEDYYKQAPEWIRKTITPVFSTLADMIQAEAAREVGVEAGMTEELKEFVREYTEAFAARHAGSSGGQIKALIRDARAQGLDAADLIDERLGEWEEKRPGKVAMNESVQESNAVARFVFVAAGITLLRWVALGSDSCPYCQEMNGRVVGVDRPFLGNSDTLESDDGRMRINRPTTHPPLHQGCVCAIVPE